MFATLAAGYPPPPDAGSVEDAVRDVLAVQAAAGLEPLVDAGLWQPDPVRWAASALDAPGFAARAWRQTTALAPGGPAVKQILPGPYTIGRWSPGPPGPSGLAARQSRTLAFAERLNAEVRELAQAGCPFVQIDEPDAVRIGEDDRERRLFREAQSRLLEGVSGIHPSLAILGGNADAAGPGALFDAPYLSYLFDLIEGPDNWRLVAVAPGDRGIICGAMDHRTARLDEREILVWAVHYAASTGGRGLVRVGLAPSGSLGALSWDEAGRKIGRLAEAASVAALPGRELARGLDPRALSGPSKRFGRRRRSS